MLEVIRCSCNSLIATKYSLFKYLKDEKKLKNKEILELLNVTKECCKLKFICVAQYDDYL